VKKVRKAKWVKRLFNKKKIEEKKSKEVIKVTQNTTVDETKNVTEIEEAIEEVEVENVVNNLTREQIITKEENNAVEVENTTIIEIADIVVPEEPHKKLPNFNDLPAFSEIDSPVV